MAVGVKLHARYRRAVLVEGDEALAIRSVPDLNLAVLAARRHVHSRGRVSHLSHVVEVTLLLEHISLRLPLPDEQLTESLAGERDPVACLVE